VRDYALTLLVAAAVTYVLTPLVRRFAIAVGAIKQPRERDVHTAPVPEFGGLAMYLGLAAALFVANEISQLHNDAIAGTGMLTGLLGAGGVLVIIGMIDDRWGLSALTKAAGQVAAAGILVATGSELSWLPLPGGSGRIFIPSSDEGALLTILIVVATINAVNFIDGLDGLAAGIVAIAAVSFFAYYYSLTKLVDISSLAAPALASAVLIGMCVGFLPHNFAPAKIFMGDTGAMLLGLVLAYAPISSINSLPAPLLEYSINRYPVIMPVLLPMVLLVIPYGDMLFAVVRRTRAGQSPFAADRKHLHHRLLDFGHSQRASVLIMYLWAAAFSGIVVWLSIDKTELPKAHNHYGEPVIVFVLITAVAVAILMLLSMPWRHWREQARNGAAAARAAATASMRPEGALAGRANGVSGTSSRPGTGLASAAAPARSAVLSASRQSEVGQGDGRERALGGDGPPADAGDQAEPDQSQPDDEAGNGYLPAAGVRMWRAAAGDAAGAAGPQDSGAAAELGAGDGAGPAQRQDSGAAAELGAGDGAGAAPWQDSGDSTEPDAGDAGSRAQADDGRPPNVQDDVSGGAGWRDVERGDGKPAGAARPAEFGSVEGGGRSAAVPPTVSDGDDWAWFRPTAGSLPEVGRSRDS
jgi:UDP-GlcNAc:undecaprenyl-phosphate/decaprenyl-phosphate GlcNAc-1-phosphate transferase